MGKTTHLFHIFAFMLDYNLANLVLILLMFKSLKKPVYRLRRTSNNDVIAAVLGRSFCFITFNFARNNLRVRLKA